MSNTLAWIAAASMVWCGCDEGAAPAPEVPSTTSTCEQLAGDGCGCPTGTLGKLGCDDAGNTRCICPTVSPSCTWSENDAPCFTPCGGEPFGSWELESTCFAAQHTKTGTCEESATATWEEGVFQLDVLDGGLASITVRQSWSSQKAHTYGCFMGAQGGACYGLYSNSPTHLFEAARLDCFEEPGCQRCTCRGDASKVDEVALNGTYWSREATVLSIGRDVRFNYCVENNSMWVGRGTTGVAYKLKRVNCTGTPLPCSSRTAAECSASGFCRLGACEPVGATAATKCTAATSSSACGVLAGCSWNAAVCVGTAPSTCDVGNCRLDPGCSTVPASP